MVISDFHNSAKLIIKRPKIVGILNLTPDSFSDGGKFFEENNALNQLNKMLDEGVDIVDIGAESTRPNAQILDAKTEISRLEKILPKIISLIENFNQKHNRKVQSSIDSYHFDTVVFAHQNGVKIINDVSGLIDEKIIKYIAKHQLPTILMHNLSIHANPDIVINSELNVFNEISSWLQQKINILSKYQIDKSQLIFDPGIGFGKNAKQSINIIKNIESYKNFAKNFNMKIYIGHSKKSFLDNINFPQKPNMDRAEKTLKISQYLAQKKVDYLRVHDIKENLEAIKTMTDKIIDW